MKLYYAGNFRVHGLGSELAYQRTCRIFLRLLFMGGNPMERTLLRRLILPWVSDPQGFYSATPWLRIKPCPEAFLNLAQQHIEWIRAKFFHRTERALGSWVGVSMGEQVSESTSCSIGPNAALPIHPDHFLDLGKSLGLLAFSRRGIFIS